MTASANFTEQQRRAITTRDVSVALSAGAGCGKTFVLTERFLSYLEPPEDADAATIELGELVAFTYTERAAREMRDRIRRKCAERLERAPERHAPYWLELLRQLDTARVSTIHSFCNSFLRSHAVEAGIDPQFRVLDPAAVQTMLWESLDDVLRTRLEARDEMTMRLAGRYELAPLRERVLMLLRHRDLGALDAFAATTPDELVARWEILVRQGADAAIARLIQSPTARAARAYAGSHGIAHPKIVERMALLESLFETIATTENRQAALAAMRECTMLGDLRAKAIWPSAEQQGRHKALMTALRGAIDDLSHLELDPKAARLAAEYGLGMLGLARDAARAFRDEKRSQHCLDYNDLLLESRRVLVAPESADLRRRMSRQIRLLLVDESQDTDPVQAELIDALCDHRPNDGKLFVVGDIKQSIYRFMGAEPQLFRRRRTSVPRRGQLPLSKNFRSQPAILDFVNLLFREEMGDDYEPLVAHREQRTPTPTIEFLWANEPEVDAADATDTSDAADTPSSAAMPSARRSAGDVERLRKLEADWIARRIAALIGADGVGGDGVGSGEEGKAPPLIPERGKEGEPTTLRPVRPGDVAILFRGLSNVHFYEEALRRYGLPYYLVGGRAFYSQQEIFDVANLLRAVVSASDEVSLAGVLRSAMFNLSDDALFLLARHPRGLGGAFLEGFLPAALDDESHRRMVRAQEVIADLRSHKDRMPVTALVERAIDMTGYDAALLSEFLGERKLANLQKLLGIARSFDRSGLFSLSDFVVQLSEFVADQPKEALAATESESGDVIRLMTIHQSKGLEFPVVVVADCETPLQGDSDPAKFHPEWGPLVGLPRFGDEEDHDDATTGLRAFKAQASIEEQQEAIRLFYVATTRAADWLILSGGLADLDKPRGFWTKFLGGRFDRLTGEFVGDAEPEDRPPAIRVITTRPETSRVESSRKTGADLAKIVEKITTRVAAHADEAALAPPRECRTIALDEAARRFFSFSQLRDKLVAEVGELGAGEGELEMPASSFSALELGTLVHAVIEDLRWDGCDDVPAFARREIERHFQENDEMLAATVELVERLLASPVGRAIASARQRHNEVEFLMPWPPVVGGAAAAKANSADEPPILHGFLDCLFQDAAGGWHIVDYKTNRVTAAEVPTAARDYEMQMLLYALATESALGVAPTSVRLYFLTPGEEFAFDWNDANRRRAVELVSTALVRGRMAAT